MEKFKNKYRIASTRATYWDYGWNAAYFITIITQNWSCWFGKVKNKKMELSDLGACANSCWLEIPNHFPFVELGAHVIMPNHVHGILIINKPVETQNIASPNGKSNRSDNVVETQYFASPNGKSNRSDNVVETQYFASPNEKPNRSDNVVETQNIASLQTPQNKFGPQSQNLAAIVRGFKIGVTKNARLIHPKFKWQPRFHDHIIRDERAFNAISNYILKNPAKWNSNR
jgi:REP element-mobilizing transposase RayT